MKQAIGMETVINWVQGLDGRFVVDKTGMKGLYDIPQADLDVGPPQPGSSAPWEWRDILQQLGLKLESTRGPVDILTIDRVEKPSAN